MVRCKVQKIRRESAKDTKRAVPYASCQQPRALQGRFTTKSRRAPAIRPPTMRTATPTHAALLRDTPVRDGAPVVSGIGRGRPRAFPPMAPNCASHLALPSSTQRPMIFRYQISAMRMASSPESPIANSERDAIARRFALRCDNIHI